MADKSLTFKIFGKDVSGSKALKGVGKAGAEVSRGIGKVGVGFALAGAAAVAAGAAVAVGFGKASLDAFKDAQASQAAFEAAMAKAPGLKGYTGKIDALAQSLATKTKYDDDATKSAATLLSRFNLTGKQLEKSIPLVQDYASATGTDLDSASIKVGKAFLGNTKALKELGIAYKPTGDKAKDFAAITDLLQKKVGGFAENEGKTAAGASAILANKFGELQEKVGSFLLPVLDKLVGWLSVGVDWLSTFFDALTGNSEMGEFDGALKIVNNAGVFLYETFQTVSAWVTTSLIPAIQKLSAWFMVNLWPAIVAVGGWIKDSMIPAIKNLADGFVKNVWPAIQKVAGIIAENLQPVIAALADYWTNTLLPAWEQAKPVLEKLGIVIGGIIAVIAVVVSWIVGKLAPIFLWVASKILPILIGAVGLVVDTIIGIVGAVVSVWNGVTEWFGKIVGFVQGLPGKIASAASGMWDGIKDSFRSAINWLISHWNDFQLRIGGQHIDLPFGQSFDIPSVTLDTPNIPMLANGGIVTRPTLALIGEAGPEAVVPLSRGGGMGGGVVVNITSPLGTPDQIARAVFGAVRKANGGGSLNAAFGRG